MKKKLSAKLIDLQNFPGQASVQTSYAQACQIAEQAFKQNAIVIAEFRYQQVHATAPKEIEPGLKLLALYAIRGKLSEGASLANKLLRHHPRSITLLWQMAELADRGGDYDSAHGYLQKSAALAPGKTGTLYRMARLANSYGHHRESRLLLKKILEIDSLHANAVWNLIVNHGDRSDKVLKSLQDILDSNPGNTSDDAMVYYAAARTSTNDNEQFAFLHKANSLLAATRQWDIRPDIEKFEKLSERFLPAVAKSQIKSVESPNTPNTPIFIAALPRSGTTLLEQILGAHTQTHGIGESMAFCWAIQDTAVQLGLKPGYEEWSNLEKLTAPLATNFWNNELVQKTKGKHLVDKSIDNFENIGAILSAMPDAKIICLKRHPLDVILSNYQACFARGFHYSFKLEDLAEYSKLFSDYMNLWEDEFGERIFFIEYENLVTAPETALTELLEYCDLPWEDGCMRFFEQESRIATASVTQARQPIHTNSIGRWKRYSKHLKPAADILEIDLENSAPASKLS
ncbi:MAG: sulfotransferase [Halioglobus sp.]